MPWTVGKANGTKESMNHWMNHHRFIGARKSERPFVACGKIYFMEICLASKSQSNVMEAYDIYFLTTQNQLQLIYIAQFYTEQFSIRVVYSKEDISVFECWFYCKTI